MQLLLKRFGRRHCKIHIIQNKYLKHLEIKTGIQSVYNTCSNYIMWERLVNGTTIKICHYWNLYNHLIKTFDMLFCSEQSNTNTLLCWTKITGLKFNKWGNWRESQLGRKYNRNYRSLKLNVFLKFSCVAYL